MVKLKTMKCVCCKKDVCLFCVNISNGMCSSCFASREFVQHYEVQFKEEKYVNA